MSKEENMHETLDPVDRQQYLSSLTHPEYFWSVDLLASFTFLMSGHGVPVCASMMLGDAEYARERLRLACTLDDHPLQQLALEMLGALSHLSPARQSAQWEH